MLIIRIKYSKIGNTMHMSRKEALNLHFQSKSV